GRSAEALRMLDSKGISTSTPLALPAWTAAEPPSVSIRASSVAPSRSVLASLCDEFIQRLVHEVSLVGILVIELALAALGPIGNRDNCSLVQSCDSEGLRHARQIIAEFKRKVDFQAVPGHQ